MWNPDPRLYYRGKYPSFELSMARQVLIGTLSNTNSIVLERLKPRIGIHSAFGPPVPLLPPMDPPTQSLGSAAAHTTSKSDEEVPSKRRRLTHEAASATVTSDTHDDESSSSKEVATKSSKNTHTSVQGELIDFTADVDIESNTQDAQSGSFFLGDTGGEPVTETLKEMYKCDFCQFATGIIGTNEMQAHLQEKKHFSASMYKTRQTEDNNVEFVYVVNKVALKNRNAKNEVLVVVCPKCNDVFEDIFMCGLHYKDRHGGQHGFYAICPVIFQDTTVVENSPSCDSCNMRFESHRKLHEHWRNAPKHHLIPHPLPETAFALFKCSVCNVTFYNNFYSCKSHLLNHNFVMNLGQSACSMEVRYIEKPTKSMELPPDMEDMEGGNGLQKSLNTLRNMKKHFKKMSGARYKRQLIGKEIKQQKSYH